MQAAKLVIDVNNGLVWSHRPESATIGPLGPNLEFPVPNNGVHSSVAMTEPQHARRVVVSRPTNPSSTPAVEPRAPPTPPVELLESVTLTDVNQPDINHAHVDRSKTQQRFCVDASQSEDEKDVAASVMEINQCYRDHVDVLRSRPAHCMLSDSEYSDFDESDKNDKWAAYQRDYQTYIRSSKEPTQTDIHIVTDKK